jgi:hypothetical protein
VPRSDGACEFGESCREAQVWRDVDREFVVATRERVRAQNWAVSLTCRFVSG